MTEHTHRQKGRNVARLIHRVAPGCRLSPGGAPQVHARPGGTLRKIKSACGPGVYLRCSTSGAKHYASVLSCNHPTARPPYAREHKGLRPRMECVYTLAHAADLLHARYEFQCGKTWTEIRISNLSKLSFCS